MTAALRAFFSKEREPVRRKLYGFVGPVLALLVAHGYLTSTDADYLSAIVGSLLLVPVTEWVRSAVAPMEARTAVGRHRAVSR